MIPNGAGLGPMANHSPVMDSRISRVGAAVTDLISLLQRGEPHPIHRWIGAGVYRMKDSRVPSANQPGPENRDEFD
ncbi:DUF2333 family protein [Thiocapsa roseopersicina]|uniref:Uncharacterized protein n=1 Tax=Thiocapsa roseopersicina TaxID=1058 RepID=A0A1H2RQK6_THIRO|nr:hypothetical protein SAMN05421783_102129 [Thiocapsa roseopersicina]